MKKLIAILLLCALALSGCAGKGEAAIDGESTNGGAPALEPPVETQSGEMVLLESSALTPIWYCGSSSIGACKFEAAGTDYPDWQRLVYYDYAAATKRPVCAKKGCAHADPSCEAFSPIYHEIYQQILCYGDDILFVSQQVPLEAERFGETKPVGIEVCKSDGSERRTLVSYGDRTEPISDFSHSGGRVYSYSEEALARIEPGKGPVGIYCFLCDGKYFWYCLTEIEKDENGEPRVETSIIKLDYATGEQLGKAATTSAGDLTLGLWRGKLLSSGVPLNSDGGRSFPLSYYATDLDTGEVETVYSGEVNMNVDADDSLGVHLTGGEIYQSRPDEHALYWLNEGGEMEKVMDLPESWARFYLHDYGDTLLFGASEDSSSKQYLCDGLGGELRLFTPLTYSPGLPGRGDQPLPICGESGDEFFVFVGSNKTQAAVHGPDGTLIKDAVYAFNYAMMKKSDYLAAKADFRDFTEVS